MDLILTIISGQNENEIKTEKRFRNEINLLTLFNKLELITGIELNNQIITLLDSNYNLICNLSIQSTNLSLLHFNIKSGMIINVNQKNINLLNQFNDTTKVDKFNLTQQQYQSRSDTVRSYKQFHKLGRFSPPNPDTLQPAPQSLPLPESFKVGARCQVALSDEMLRRGVIRFIGITHFGNTIVVGTNPDGTSEREGEIWIGVEFDEPVGKGDGSVEGTRYFQTLPLRASFLRPDKIEVGDFEELDPFAELDDEDEEM